MKSPILSGAMVLTFSLGALNTVYADSATWSTNPISSDWNTAQNWTPNTVPNSFTDVATFGTSVVTEVTLTTDFLVTYLASLQFNPGADNFIITSSAGALSFVGDGIVNNSGTTQQFTATHEGSSLGTIAFSNSASCGEGTNFSALGGYMYFYELATAATAHFTVSDDSGVGGRVNFFGGNAANATFDIGVNGFVGMNSDSTAANATFTITGGTLTFDGSADGGESVTDCSDGGQVIISTLDTGALGTPQITAHGATSSHRQSGHINFIFGGTADHATFVVEGGTSAQAHGASMSMEDGSDLQNAQVTVTGGTSGGDGGSIILRGLSDGGSAGITMSGNATFDMSRHDPGTVSVGSLAGQGSVFLGANNLTTGSNDLSTIFSGVIQDGGDGGGTGGSVTEIGDGTLTLSSANTYTGGTTISKGTLFIKTKPDSGTGSGKVVANTGTLGGTGTIDGAVAIGKGNGTGAFLSPGTNGIGTLTLKDTLTFKLDGTYQFELNSSNVKADKVIAKGVTIRSGAQFSISDRGSGILTAGTTFIAIRNTAATPFSGTFANLPDGSTITIGSNNFQVNYQGGDGNDLTLTVVL